MANYSIPTWEVAKLNKMHFRRAGLEKLINRARELKISTSYFNKDYPWEGPRDLSIRELRASDVGLKKWQTPPLIANQYVPWVDYHIPEEVIVIYAVALLSKNPHVTSIKADIGHAYTLDLVEVEKLQVVLPLLRKLREHSTKEAFADIYDLSEIVMEAYFSEIWEFHGGDWLRLSVFSEVSAPGDRILLRGFIGETWGKTLA